MARLPSTQDPTRGQDSIHAVKYWPLTITIPAVKITEVVPALPLFPLLDKSIPPPDTCLSSPPEIKLEPIDSTLFPTKEEKLPSLLADEDNEDEFGEFLLDAVQWGKLCFSY
jgi:hypothetical protein